MLDRRRQELADQRHAIEAYQAVIALLKKATRSARRDRDVILRQMIERKILWRDK